MAIKSFVKIKPPSDDGPFSGSFNEIRKGINRTGEVTESIANNMVETHKLIKFEKEWLSDRSDERVEKVVEEEATEKKGFKKWLSNWTKMFRRKKRDQAEKVAEKGIDDGTKENEGLKEKAAKKALGFFGRLAKMLGPLFNFFVLYGAFDWLSKNSEKATKIFQVIFGIGKFAFALAGFGIDALFGGLTNMFGNFKEGPIRRGFRFLFGFLSFVGGFGVLRYLLNPLKIFSDGKKLKKIFSDQTGREVEAKNYEMWRKTGYRDKETGKIYTEQEYKAQKKSVAKQQKKLQQQGRFEDARKLGKAHNKRVGATHLQKGKNIGGKLMQPGMQKGIAAVGGITRAFAGISQGEDATQAIGAGMGQAAGGMVGAALLTPFLGPFGPIVGNALGGFLGEWIGKTFLPVIKPIFGPIKDTFVMFKDLIFGVFKDLGIGDFLSTLFKFIGGLGGLLMKGLKPLLSFIGFILGGAIKIIGGILKFIISAAKNIFAFMMNPIGFAWKVIRGKDPGKDVKLEEVEEKSEGGVVKNAIITNQSFLSRSEGGPVYQNVYHISRAEGGPVYNQSFIQPTPQPMILGGIFGGGQKTARNKRRKKSPFPKGWKPVYEIINETHVPGNIRSIEYNITNMPKGIDGSGERIYSGETYVQFSAMDILHNKHKKKVTAEPKGDLKPLEDTPKVKLEQSKKEKKGRGFRGMLAGIADTMTGGIFDFDGRGNNWIQNLQQMPFKMAAMGAKGLGHGLWNIAKGLGMGVGLIGKGVGAVGRGIWNAPGAIAKGIGTVGTAVGKGIWNVGKAIVNPIGALAGGIGKLFGMGKKPKARFGASTAKPPEPRETWSAMSIDKMRDLSEKRTEHLAQFQYKAQRDKDAEKFMPTPRTMIRTIRQPVINNTGNNPVPIYAPTSPMFTC